MSTSGRPLFFTPIVVLAAGAIAASWVHPGHADAPLGRYVVNSGTVLDTKTGLTWQQSASDMPDIWLNAQTYCMNLNLGGTGWRLPSMKELQTIVDRTVVMPTIDQTAFPKTPIMVFWTSSAWAASPGSAAWVIKFSDGYTAYRSKTLTAHYRCVR